MLTRIEHPVAKVYPYTLGEALIVIGEYDAKLEKANDRFVEIQYIQSGENKSKAAEITK